MKKPTIDEMKLLVAGMIPDVLTVDYSLRVEGPDWKYEQRAFWRDTNMAVTEREWLHVCWLAEESLGWPECNEYHDILSFVVIGRRALSAEWEPSGDEAFRISNAGADQRLEALCRIKHPDLFQ